jgi:hypothetical protein
MFLTQVFYIFKPVIPRWVQIALRRKLAANKRRKYAHVWPIDPNSANPPEGWQGWAEGKNFALVLSHDVDTLRGYQAVLKLAALEEKLGFRSTFNFVPERYGRVSLDLLDELRRRGFGVAVHGLKHDGKLFLSRRIFSRQARRINGYLKDWKTAGFTSPSMHRNLDWMTDLNIQYSISTFDTDPYEPQPDGVGTIFPFVVNKRSDQNSVFSLQESCSHNSRNPNSPSISFVELPYTLPQDSTLFIILQEKTTEIWKRKLDWIADKGGMALLNTHPDYMNFGNGECGWEQYPIALYEEFLVYVKEHYAGEYFHTLAEEVADLTYEKRLLQ